MGIALFATTSLFAPLQELACRLSRRSSAERTARPAHRIDGPHQTTSTAVPPSRMKIAANDPGSRRPPSRTLRVLHLVESGQTGRLRICGRMADVCAELDRLAALEQA